MEIAIIGAGMAGLACGTALAKAGHGVRLFDKGRGPGGRMSTRRGAVDGQTLHFDHGAQYFTARDPAFLEMVADWERHGLAARWPAAGEDAWVGTPTMNTPLRAMAEALGVEFERRVLSILDGSGWVLHFEDGGREGPFDTVLVSVPAEQAGDLLRGPQPQYAATADSVSSDPCWTMMAAFDQKPDLPDTLRNRGAIGWAARNNAKPGRAETECWVVQASPEWSRGHLEQDPDMVASALLAALAAESGNSLPTPSYLTAHRWRYARCHALDRGALWDASTRLGVCGDWLSGPRVENAFLSGRALARMVAGDG